MISRIIISKNRHTVHTVLCQKYFSVRKIAPLICQHLPRLQKKKKIIIEIFKFSIFSRIISVRKDVLAKFQFV